MSIWTETITAFAALFGSDTPRRVGRPVAFTVAVIALAAKMAKADGRVTHDEIQVFRDSFEIPSSELPNVARVFDLARRSANGYEIYARRIGKMFADDPAVLEEVIDVLLLIAEQDGGVKELEIEFLHGVAREMGVANDVFEQLRATHFENPEQSPHEVLGIPEGADSETVKRAWRRHVQELHPDTLIAKGVPVEFIKVATERLLVVNRAYAALTKSP